MAATNIEPGAQWLRCDLHVHTPFDQEKKFGEDVRGAIEALKNAKPQRLAEIADRFVQACRSAVDGAGIDIVALTDHNSVDGYRYLSAQFETLARQAKDRDLPMPAILPGVEFSVGGERPIHFLVIFSCATDPDDIDRAISYVFGANDRFDPRVGTPRATGESVNGFLDRLYAFCRPPSGDRSLAFVVLPAHADGRQGLGREVVGGSTSVSVATSLWDEMKGHLRQRVITRRDWHGFEASRSFDRLPPAFQELLWRWAAARGAEAWDSLSDAQKARYRDQQHWPIVQCSDPHNYDAIGSSYTWLKMAVPDVEGIRLALLDPQSRLRRMEDGPPRRVHTRIERLRVRHTDFFEDVELPFNPCLTTLIGGRGTGKSTAIEYVRHALDRCRNEDFPYEESNTANEAVRSVLSPKGERDFGSTRGTLLPEHEIEVDIVVAQRRYRIIRSNAGANVYQEAADDSEPEQVPLEVRSLIAPRVLSQRQIAQIARSPASQRTELDALIDADRRREIESRRRQLSETLTQLQTTRTRLTQQSARIPSVETEFRTVQDQIDFLQSEGRKDVLERFASFERQRAWLDDRRKELNDLADRLEGEPDRVRDGRRQLLGEDERDSMTGWLASVDARIETARETMAATLMQGVRDLRDLSQAIGEEQADQWQPGYEQAREAYAALHDEMVARGVDFAQHEKLLQRRAQLERELGSLASVGQQREEIAARIRDTRLLLVETHETRLSARRDQAKSLESMDADVRLDVRPFRDRSDFEGRREQWFGGAGLQERDWMVLCDYIFAEDGQVPDRIAALAGAVRADLDETTTLGRPLEESASAVLELVGPNRHLTGHFLNALLRRDRVRVDEIERFLPEDQVLTQVRTVEGTFKTIETGSVGEKSTAILSLLLSAGDQPIIIDQPEDDLDNQYVYNVVVDLLRRRKFSRQVIIATHNANIPVNGDAELIVALGTRDRLGEVLGSGSIDQPEVKERVSIIMEGSAEAFRLRRERYGY